MGWLLLSVLYAGGADRSAQDSRIVLRFGRLVIDAIVRIDQRIVLLLFVIVAHGGVVLKPIG